MNPRLGWLLPGLAVVSTGVAIWADGNFALSVPAASVAVAAAGLFFVHVVPSEPSRPPRPERPIVREGPARIRSAFRSGRLGREEILNLLDGLERSGPNPNLPGRRIEELAQLRGLSSREFRDYVRERLDDLEART